MRYMKNIKKIIYGILAVSILLFVLRMLVHDGYLPFPRKCSPYFPNDDVIICDSSIFNRNFWESDQPIEWWRRETPYR